MKLAPGTIIRADAFLFDMDGTLVDLTDAIERVDTLGPPSRFDTVTSPIGDTWRAHCRYCSRTCTSRQRYRCRDRLSFFRRNTRKSMESCPWPVRANCWNACRVTDGLLSPQPTEVCRKPECISPACQKRRYSLPLKTSRRENPRPMVTGSPAENLGLDCEGTVVFENSDTSILAGRNAGCPVIAVTATHVTPVLDQIDWIEDFASISVECTDRDVSLRVT